ncbi:MAG: FMN-binding protein [Firmicutes bacterium]|nr:FMN-binding protein [Bacillota bacterium]
MGETAKLGAILGLVCAIAGASLALVHAVTSDIIIARQEAELISRLQELVPEAEQFETIEPEEGVILYLGKKGSDTVGAVLEGKATGYGGPMRILVSVDADNRINGVSVIEHGETIGIGTRALEPGWLQQFIGLAHDEQLVAGKNVDIITGATVSSRAVMSGVAHALELYQTHVLKTEVDDSWNLAKVPDGVYEGTAPGFQSEITVKVTVEAGRIVEVEVTAIADTPQVYPAAVEKIPPRIVEKQHWQVDAVAGATISSKGIMEAVRAAIPDTSLKIDQIADGVYEGTGQGFGGAIKVQVEVKDGAITNIQVLSHSETDGISAPALNQIPQSVIDQQSVKVDTVSGATYTSKGLLEAINAALEAAPLRD